jgi:hypothetical protein
MDNLVLEGQSVHPTREENYQLGGMLLMLDTLLNPWWPYDREDNPYVFSLGYTVYFYLMQMWDQGRMADIKLLTFDGVTPSHETILSGEYALTTNYFVVIRANTPQGHPARNIAEWLATPGGQDVVREAGLGTMN